MSRPVHFELNVPEPARTVAFMEQVFGWTFQSWNDQPYWLATTGGDDAPGINGAVQGAEDGVPRTINTMGVDDLDATIAAVGEAGGTVVHEKMPVQGMGWVAYFTDPNGLLFGAFEVDDTAG